jgi:hypothetical protein
MVKITFSGEEDYISLLNSIIETKPTTLEGLDALVAKHSLEKPTLERSNLVPEDMSKSKDEEEKEVISRMNKIYLNGGRPGLDWTDYQKCFAADYALQLLEGICTNVEGEKVEMEITTELAIERTLQAFTDFTGWGHKFICGYGDIIPDEKIARIKDKLIEKVEEAEFTTEGTSRVFHVLTSMSPGLLPSAEGSYLTDSSRSIPFDYDLANGKLKQELLAYARSI